LSNVLINQHNFTLPASETCYPLTGSEGRTTSISQLMGLSVSAGTDIVGKDITEISFYLRQNNSPTGTVYVRAWDSTSDIPSSPAVTFGSFDASALSGSSTKETFTLSSGSYTVLAGSQIGLDRGSGAHSGDIYMEGNFSDNTYGQWWVDSYTQPYELISSGNAGVRYCWFG